MSQGLVGLFGLALAVSLDGLGAGMGYGLRRTRLDWRDLGVIGLVAGLTAFASTGAGQLAGHLLGRGLGLVFSRELGAALLFALGLVSIGNAWRETDEEPPHRLLWSVHLRTLGLVVEVARRPDRADLDRSGSISPAEAVILGLALALDSGAVGFGAGLAGFSAWEVAAAVAPINVALLWFGTWLGRRLAGERGRSWLSVSPGLILMALAVWRLRP